MVRDFILAGVERMTAKGTRVGRPPLDQTKAGAIQALLASRVGIRESTRRTGIDASTVQRVRAAMTAPENQERITAAAYPSHAATYQERD